MGKPSAALVAAADRALTLKLKADEMKRLADEATDELYNLLDAEKMLNPDTKGIGDLVRVTVSPNRFFNLEKAKTLVPKRVLKECEVTAVDPKLLKQHLTPIQTEQAMDSYPRAFKITLKIAD